MKIVERAPGGGFVASGCFDPLVAWHARRLAGLERDGRSLLVVVSTPRDPILPARARAELVAALECVDYVMLDGRGAPEPDVRFEREEEAALAALIERVHERAG